MADEHIRTSSKPISSPTHVKAGEPAKTPSVSKAESTEGEKAPAEHKDSLREIVETVVFVIVLVLMLKTFVAEAFVIPTGSMATTLLGHHIEGDCPKCGIYFRVNASNEVEEEPGQPVQPVTGCRCPNCDYHITGPDFLEFLGKGTE